MAKYEHSVYEPPSDEVRVFDGGEDDIDDEGSRLPLLIVIALLVLAAFGGVVWLAYTQGVQRGREGAPRVITADRGPVRTAPANPGGSTPYQGLKIYEQPAPATDEEAAGGSSTPAQATKPAPEPTQKAAEAAPTPAKSEAAKPAVAKPTAAKPAAVKPAMAKAESAPVKPAPAKPAPVQSPSAKEVASTDSYVLQIGSFKSEAEAKSAWQIYQRKHPLVGGYVPNIQRADLGAKGIWYRLRIGSFADRAAAGALCEKLKADGGGCLPAKR